MSDTRFQLDPSTHTAIYEEIERDHFKNSRPAETPRAVILGGQPGSGKSRLLEMGKREFPGGSVVTINSDDLRYFHPRHEEILRADERRFAKLTDPDVRPWTERLFNRAIQTRRNIVCEGTMRLSGPIMETMHRLQESGYAVTARVIAVHERHSIAGIHQRYEDQKAEKGFGRWANMQTHDAAYTGVLSTVEQIERNRLAGRVEIYDRQGRMLYENERQGNEWLRDPAARAAIETERQRPSTPEERRQHEAQWETVFSMMAARGAGEREIEQARELSRRDDDRQRPERDDPDYER